MVLLFGGILWSQQNLRQNTKAAFTSALMCSITEIHSFTTEQWFSKCVVLNPAMSASYSQCRCPGLVLLNQKPGVGRGGNGDGSQQSAVHSSVYSGACSSLRITAQRNIAFLLVSCTLSSWYFRLVHKWGQLCLPSDSPWCALSSDAWC